jgi:tRNA (cmo5U34)-methyltransferase
MRFDDRSLWSEEVSRVIRAYAVAARLGPRTTHLLPVFGSIALGKSGRPDIAQVTLDETLAEDAQVREFYGYLRGKTENFQHHAHASIPFILEEHCRLGAAICALAEEHVVERRRPLRLWSLGSAEAPMARAVAQKGDGAVQVLCSSENAENFASLARAPEPNVSYRTGPFYEVAESMIDGPGENSSPKWDIVFEHTSFQMHHRDRLAPLLLLRRTMSPDGVALLYEKAIDPDRAAYERREREKDEMFKSRFFSAQEIQTKKTTVLQDMEKGQVTYEELIATCRLVFGSVYLIWKSGNFVGVAASNDEERLRRLVELMPPPAVENRAYTTGLPSGTGRTLRFRPSNALPAGS